MPSMQQRYYDILIERVRTDRYPSGQLLNRLEATIFSPQQLVEYVDMLLEKVDESWYPSGELLDRIDRMLRLAAVAA
jgi:ubiquinone biosynthesis protein COQ9